MTCPHVLTLLPMLLPLLLLLPHSLLYVVLHTDRCSAAGREAHPDD
jgi:hypothetical protein